MAGKSDFAQKLLHDLRLRKERVAAAESSGRLFHIAEEHEESTEPHKPSQHEHKKCPVSFLHAEDHDDEVTKKKLVLDSAYEVMKRKARRHEVSFHPHLEVCSSKFFVVVVFFCYTEEPDHTVDGRVKNTHFSHL